MGNKGAALFDSRHDLGFTEYAQTCCDMCEDFCGPQNAQGVSRVLIVFLLKVAGPCTLICNVISKPYTARVYPSWRTHESLSRIPMMTTTSLARAACMC